jgi:hypothetical protein
VFHCDLTDFRARIVEFGPEMSSLSVMTHLNDARDSNDRQSFQLQDITTETSDFERYGRYMKITFPSSTDFYGRIVIYNLSILGKVSS